MLELVGARERGIPRTRKISFGVDPSGFRHDTGTFAKLLAGSQKCRYNYRCFDAGRPLATLGSTLGTEKTQNVARTDLFCRKIRMFFQRGPRVCRISTRRIYRSITDLHHTILSERCCQMIRTDGKSLKTLYMRATDIASKRKDLPHTPSRCGADFCRCFVE